MTDHQSHDRHAFALINANVVTGDPDGTVLPQTTVVVDAAGMITEVGPASDVPVPDSYRRVDLTGQFVAPGLINAHAHLFADGKPLPPILTNEKAESIVNFAFHSPVGKVMVKGRAKSNILTQLHSGVTTIRSLGDVAYEVVAVREEIDGGKYVGPRVLASGPLLAITGGARHPDHRPGQRQSLGCPAQRPPQPAPRRRRDQDRGHWGRDRRAGDRRGGPAADDRGGDGGHL